MLEQELAQVLVVVLGVVVELVEDMVVESGWPDKSDRKSVV